MSKISIYFLIIMFFTIFLLNNLNSQDLESLTDNIKTKETNIKTNNIIPDKKNIDLSDQAIHKEKVSPEKDNNINRKNSLLSGKWALMFKISSFNLYNFQGLGFSAKRHYTPNSSIRFGLDYDYSYSDSDGNDSYAYIDYGREEVIESISAYHKITINIQYIYYTDPDAVINFYYGAGPSVSYSFSSSEYKRTSDYSGMGGPSYNEEIFQSQSDSYGLGLGAQGVLGVEWFVSDHISLLGEYGIIAQYEWDKYESFSKIYRDSVLYRNSVYTDDDESVYFEPLSIKLGLSVYFD